MHLFAGTIENCHLPTSIMLEGLVSCRTTPPAILSARLCGFRAVERIAVVAAPLTPPADHAFEEHERWDGMS